MFMSCLKRTFIARALSHQTEHKVKRFYFRPMSRFLPKRKLNVYTFLLQFKNLNKETNNKAACAFHCYCLFHHQHEQREQFQSGFDSSGFTGLRLSRLFMLKPPWPFAENTFCTGKYDRGVENCV